jgi:5'-3' exonuclease
VKAHLVTVVRAGSDSHDPALPPAPGGCQHVAVATGHNTSAQGTLLALDCASMYYRAYFGVPEKITAPDGTPVNAVRGFLDMITRLVSALAPDGVAAAWDEDWRPQFRVDAVPSYKTHRVLREVQDGTDVEATPDTLSPQVDIIWEVLQALGMPAMGSPGHEADDVLGTLAHHLGTPALPFARLDVVTGDRDLFQLIDDARGIRVLYVAKGVSKYEVMDEAAVAGRYMIPGRAYAAFAALRGDASDGLPGVPGIGEKTASGIVQTLPTLADIRAAMDDPGSILAAPVRAKLQAARAYLEVIDPVVLVAADAAIDPAMIWRPGQPCDEGELDRLAARWGIGTSVDRLRAVLRAREAT